MIYKALKHNSPQLQHQPYEIFYSILHIVKLARRELGSFISNHVATYFSQVHEKIYYFESYNVPAPCKEVLCNHRYLRFFVKRRFHLVVIVIYNKSI